MPYRGAFLVNVKLQYQLNYTFHSYHPVLLLATITVSDYNAYYDKKDRIARFGLLFSFFTFAVLRSMPVPVAARSKA